MKIAKKILMKHMLHKARDVKVDFEVNLTLKTVTIHVETIDTLIIERFLRNVILDDVNEELESLGKLRLIKNMNEFSIELVVEGKARFNLKLIERNFEPVEATLIMNLLT